MITRTAPVIFDPDARCPLWDAFPERIFRGNPDLVVYLQDVTGYSLTGLTGEQIALILWGLGSTARPPC